MTFSSPSDETGPSAAGVDGINVITDWMRETGWHHAMTRVESIDALRNLAARIDRVRAEATAAERARCQGIAREVMAGFTALLAGTETTKDEGGGG